MYITYKIKMNIFEHYKDIFIESINIKNIDKNKNKIAVEIPKQKFLEIYHLMLL